jgi:hypothetical protein
MADKYKREDAKTPKKRSIVILCDLLRDFASWR